MSRSGRGLTVVKSGPRVGGAEVARRPANEPVLQILRPIVAVLMLDANFRSLTLADLEWLVLPPVMVGQFGLAHAPMAPSQAKSNPGAKTQEGSTMVPVAVALWARVSDNIDKALSANLDKPLRLKAGDWVSGNNLWLMAVAGDRRAVTKFLDQLSERDFKGQVVKMRVRGQDGKAVIKTLGGSA